MNKRCAHCKEDKPLARFHSSGRQGQFAARCKDCHGLAERTCVQCGGTFIGRAAKRLCSDACRALHWPVSTKPCECCGSTFAADHLSQRFCSRKCAYTAQATGRILPRLKRTREAGRAQRAVAYHVQAGSLTRPSSCEECGERRRIEAAHYSYAEPLRVRWLCRPCHVKWDHAEPKGGVEPRVS